jgi:hypothetical protein
MTREVPVYAKPVSVPAPRKYWSERQGRGPTAVPLDFERLKTFVLTVVDELWERDYFVEAFGYYCVVNDWVEGALARSPERWFLARRSPRPSAGGSSYRNQPPRTPR